ncbi:hypothetical protein [Pantoea sp. At-9b]|uniref:hypothetical protein n=1 Tax=Pantoea sp. (strain At-9b) TaxID=592316 RepID=UPI0012375731|nr:hypothetical protein [Pantoea sp. At-9b]
MKNTRSDHRWQDNSLQTRTRRLRQSDEDHPGYKEFMRMALFNKPLSGGYLSSHPTQDFILRFFVFKT